MAKNRNKGIISLVFLAVVFASMGIFARYLNTSFLILQQVYLRILSALIISLFVFRKNINFEKIKKLPKREWWILILRASFLYLFGVTLFTKSINLTKYASASFIGALPLTGILGFIILKEKITVQKVLLLLMALVGTTILAVNDYSQLLSWGQGELIMLLAAIFFSLSYVLRPLHASKLNDQEMTVLILILGFIAVFAASILSGQGIPISPDSWSLPVLGMVTAAGIFNILNVYLVNYGFSRVKPALASNILTLEAIFAILIGMFLYNEVVTLKELVGGGVIVLGVIGMNKAEEMESKKSK